MDWHAIGVIISAISLIGGCLGYWFKLLIEKNFESTERRFQALEVALKTQTETNQEMKLAFQKIQAEMPNIYMRREECARCKEDWTYLQSVIDAKLDILGRKLRALRRAINDRKNPQ